MYTQLRKSLLRITIAPVLMAGGVLLGACTGGPAAIPPVDATTAAITTCVETARMIVVGTPLEDLWSETQAIADCKEAYS